MNLRDEVRQRELTAVLAEVAGDGPPPDLARRIAQRLRQLPAQAPPRRRSLAAALLMLAGIAVVVAAGVFSRIDARDAAAPAVPDDTTDGAEQDRPVAVVTTAMVRARELPVDVPEGDGVERLVGLAKAAKTAIVIGGDVRGESRLDLARVAWREAVDRVAAELGTGVAEFGDVLVVGLGAPVAVERLRVSLATEDLELAQFAKLLHAKTGINLVVAANATGRVRCQVEAVPARVLLDVVAEQLGLQISGCGRVLAVVPRTTLPSPRQPAFSCDRDDVGRVLDRWAHTLQGNLVIEPRVGGAVTVEARLVERASLLAALAAAVGADACCADVLRDLWFVAPSVAPSASMSLTGERTNLLELAPLVGPELSPLLQLPAEPGAPFTAFVTDAPAIDVLRAAARTAGKTVEPTGRGYKVR